MTEEVVEYETIYQQAVIKWGVDSQIEMLIEEMGELIVALQHAKRKRVNNVAEEIADVEICLRQIKPIFNKEKEVDKWHDLKIKRLSERVGR